MKVLLCVTGSVAAIKARELYDELLAQECVDEVRVVATASALKFFARAGVDFDPAVLFSDDSEWSAWQRRGDSVLHVELAKWADVVLLAPLSAKSLSSMARGHCDDLVQCSLLAFDLARASSWVVVAPAMNCVMWRHPVVRENLAVVRRAYGDALVVVDPIAKTLMCGDDGVGAMAEPKTIAQRVGQCAIPRKAKKEINAVPFLCLAAAAVLAIAVRLYFNFKNQHSRNY